MTAPLRFGVFVAPFHPVGQSPTVALEYDLDRVVALDRLGYDEAWFGEHHSAKGKRDELLGGAGVAVVNAIKEHTSEIGGRS